MYWRSLFDPKNLSDVCMKLNGEAELFYREKSILNPIIHPKGQKIENKTINYKKPHSTFEYDLIKDRRFTKRQFQLHIPISSNFKSEDISAKNLNLKVHEHLKNNPDTKIIGIDRGENNLLYICVIDQNRNIILEKSLNSVGETIKRDYFELLEAREKDQHSAQKEWRKIEAIKDLKSGYLSQVIHEITKLMIKENAIIVLEDLNLGFKRTRQKITRQIYQKFEKMLIDKLTFYVDKGSAIDEPGGVLQAYQLSAPFISFEKLDKQSGFIFYVPAAYTSVVDPSTGFAPVYKFKYRSIEDSQKILSHITRFVYNQSKHRFEIDINFETLCPKFPYKYTLAIEDGVTRHLFNLQSKQDKTQSRYLSLELDQEIKTLFTNYQIPYTSGKNLIASIISQQDKSFFNSLLYYLNVLTKIRYQNSADPNQKDYILSPAINTHDQCFDSRNPSKNLPRNGDSNGAYHIALKGLWTVNQIKQNKPEQKLDLALRNSDWFEFIKK